MSVEIYPFPEGLAASPDYALKVNGEPVFVHQTPVASFAAFGCDEEVEVEVIPSKGASSVIIRPLRHLLVPALEGGAYRFRMQAGLHLSFEVDGDLDRPLFLFANELEGAKPDPDDPAVLFFEGGKVHEAGQIDLTGGQTLYLEGGAVVRGNVFAERADGIAIRGFGLLDVPAMGEEEAAAAGKPIGASPRGVLLGDCRGIEISGLMIHKVRSWTVCPFGCEQVSVRDIKVVTERAGGDGIDVMGSRDVTIEDCFFRTNDDCIAIKAGPGQNHEYPYACGNVERVRASRRTLWNDSCGNAIEIGYETVCAWMRDIIFEEMDIIHVEFEGWNSGAVISIHNGDRADVENVIFRKIRVEDTREKLIDFRVLHAPYTKLIRKGNIRNILVEDLAVVDGPLPPSIIEGWWESGESNGKVEQIHLKGLTWLGSPLRDNIEARLICAKTDDVFIYENAGDTEPSWSV